MAAKRKRTSAATSYAREKGARPKKFTGLLALFGLGVSCYGVGLTVNGYHNVLLGNALTVSGLVCVLAAVGYGTLWDSISRLSFPVRLIGVPSAFACLTGLLWVGVNDVVSAKSFVYVAPGVWLNGDTWDFLVMHRGPENSYNIEVFLVDEVKQQQVLKGKRTLTPDELNSYQTLFRVPEIDAHGSGSIFASQLLWRPPDADHERYTIVATSRDGSIAEDLRIERVAAGWFWSMTVTDRLSGKVLIDCQDKGFPSSKAKPLECFPIMIQND